MSWTSAKEQLTKKAQSYDKSAKLLVKETSLFMKILAWMLFILSFGKYKKETFLEEMATCIANRLYIPSGWSILSVEHVLPHEIAGHAKQARKCALGLHPLVGLPVMALAYILLPFPVGGAFCRLFFEIDADTKYWEEILKGPSLTPEPIILAHAERRADSLASSKYFWSVPKFISRYFYRKAAKGVINDKT